METHVFRPGDGSKGYANRPGKTTDIGYSKFGGGNRGGRDGWTGRLFQDDRVSARRVVAETGVMG